MPPPIGRSSSLGVAQNPHVTFVLLLIALGAASVMLDAPGRWAAGYGLLRHAEWDGVAAADLVSPIFLFLLGVSIPLLSEKSQPAAIVVRAALLIAIGVLLSGYPRFDLSTWRIPGVLQRAGVGYAVAGLAYRATSGDRRRRGAILVSAAAFLALGYWLVMTHVPVPGGTADDLSREGNLAAWADRALMRGHVWSARWDPDGLFSTVSSLSTALFGVVAGMCLASGQRPARTAWQLAGAGAAGIAGGILWSPMFPLNRTLWSGPFVVLGGGIASLLLAIGYWASRARHGGGNKRSSGPDNLHRVPGRD
jgi:predicted acyltransferase